MRASSYDAVVIGAGPAGLAAAIALRRLSASVGVFDAPTRLHHANRVETVQGKARALLEEIGIEGALSMAGGIPVPSIITRWSDVESERPNILDPYGPSFHVRRGAFRLSLAKIARRNGVHLFFGHRAHATPNDCGWDVRTEAMVVRAHFLIAATGRSSVPISGRIGRWCADNLVAAFGCCRPRNGIVDLNLQVYPVPDGWWYAAPRDATNQQIAFLSDIDLLRNARRKDAFWFSHLATGAEFARAADIQDEDYIVAANTYCREAVIGDDVILVGDAAMSGDPLAGDGITWALRSGICAAEIASGSAQKRKAALIGYSDQVLTRFRDFISARSKTYAQLSLWPGSPFWARRLTRGNRVVPLTTKNRLVKRWPGAR